MSDDRDEKVPHADDESSGKGEDPRVFDYKQVPCYEGADRESFYTVIYKKVRENVIHIFVCLHTLDSNVAVVISRNENQSQRRNWERISMGSGSRL